MKLLKEFTTFEYDKDDAKDTIAKGGPLILKGILQRGDTINQNGRIYPMEILERELENYKKLIREDRAWGELDHADSPIVNMKNICHMIREVWLEGTVVYGKVEILETPCGDIIRAVIKAGGRPGISSRALGSLKKHGDANIVQDDLQIICWDFVSEPSTPGAFMMSEAREVGSDELRQAFTKSDRIDRILNDILATK